MSDRPINAATFRDAQEENHRAVKPHQEAFIARFLRSPRTSVRYLRFVCRWLNGAAKRSRRAETRYTLSAVSSLIEIAWDYEDGRISRADAENKIRKHFRQYENAFLAHSALIAGRQTDWSAEYPAPAQTLAAHVAVHAPKTAPGSSGAPSRLKRYTDARGMNFGKAMEEESPGAAYLTLQAKIVKRKRKRDEMIRDLDDPQIFARVVAALERAGVSWTPEEAERKRRKARAILETLRDGEYLPPSEFFTFAADSQGEMEEQLQPLDGQTNGRTGQYKTYSFNRITETGEEFGDSLPNEQAESFLNAAELQIAIQQEIAAAEKRGNSDIAETYRLLLDGETSATEIARIQGVSDDTVYSRLKALGRRIQETAPKRPRKNSKNKIS